MGMDIFFKEDIANALAAAEQAASAVGAYSDDERAVAFLAGWRSALRTLAAAFGLSPATLTADFEPARTTESTEVTEWLLSLLLCFPVSSVLREGLP